MRLFSVVDLEDGYVLHQLIEASKKYVVFFHILVLQDICIKGAYWIKCHLAIL